MKWARRASSTCSACFTASACRFARRLTGQMPNMIWLYRRPILDYWAEHDETLGAIVNHVLVHEIGHHFGLSDDDMHAIERGPVSNLYRSEAMKIDGACHCGSSPSQARPIRTRSPFATAPIAKPRPAPHFAFRSRCPAQSFKMTGEPTTYLKTTADSGKPRLQAFCPRCGTPIYSTTPATASSRPTPCVSACCAARPTARRSGRTGGARRGRGSPSLPRCRNMKSRPDPGASNCRS